MMKEFTQKENQMPANFEFFDASQRAKTVDADGARAQIGIEKYPWRSLPIGKSFFIDTKIHTVKLSTLQSSASRWSKKLNRQFRVIEWKNGKDNYNGPDGVEVTRLPDKQEPIQEPSVGKSSFGFENE